MMDNGMAKSLMIDRIKDTSVPIYLMITFLEKFGVSKSGVLTLE
jgi:hypothetical protein